MKGRGIQLLALFAILALTLGLTGAAFAAPPQGTESTGATCEAGDVKWNTDTGIEYTDGSATITGDANSVTITITSGYTFVSGCIKIGGPGGGTTIAISGPGTYGPYAYGISHVVVTTDLQYVPCTETVAVPGEWSDWTDWIWNGEMFERTHTQTIVFVDAVDLVTICGEEPNSETQYEPACPYNPQVPISDPSCQPPPGEANGWFTPYCGGGINVAGLSNALLYVDDFDGLGANGSYPFNVGGHTYFWEALEGFEFPEGFIMEGTFNIDACPPHETPTGPETTIPIVMLISAIGLAGTGTLILRKRG